MTYDEAQGLLSSRRPLVKLETRHQHALEAWLAASQPAAGAE